MSSAGEATRFRSLSDSDLIELLYTAGDQLPREAVEELLSRGSRVLPALSEIASEKSSWTQPLPEWWAAVHATYTLGAMETPAALIPLLTALRWADAFDCDWVTEDLPSILGRLGVPAFEPLGAVVRDPSAGAGARSVALASLAATTFSAAFLKDRVVEQAANLLKDESEALYLRQTAANVLVDLRAAQHRKLLKRFGKEEAKRRRNDAEYQGVFYDWEVDELLEGASTPSSDYYSRDWLAFYEPEEIAHRQERWAREQAEAEEEPPPDTVPHRRDVSAPCSCGSGRPYAECCYLKVH